MPVRYASAGGAKPRLVSIWVHPVYIPLAPPYADCIKFAVLFSFIYLPVTKHDPHARCSELFCKTPGRITVPASRRLYRSVHHQNKYSCTNGYTRPPVRNLYRPGTTLCPAGSGAYPNTGTPGLSGSCGNHEMVLPPF